MLITKRPSDCLRTLHMDTVAYHPPAVMCAYQTLGADSFVWQRRRRYCRSARAKSIIEELPIPESEREDILGLNALRPRGDGAAMTAAANCSSEMSFE
jgi:hypothetical protein